MYLEGFCSGNLLTACCALAYYLIYQQQHTPTNAPLNRVTALLK